jgi:hypothetical protein
MNPHNIICKKVLRTNIQMTKSRNQYFVGEARSPVRGASGEREMGRARADSLIFAGRGSVAGR